MEISIPIKRLEGHVPDMISPTRIKVKVQESMTIKSVVEPFENIECAILATRGELYTANLREAKALILNHKGGKVTVYRPRFTYMGLR